MRRRNWCALAWCFLWFISCLCLSGPSFAQSVSVNEHAVRVRLDGNQITVDLPIRNSHRNTISAEVAAELVDPAGHVQSRATQNTELAPGSAGVRLKFPADFVSAKKIDLGGLLLFRLRYSVQGASPASNADGIISLGQAATNTFELHVIAPVLGERGHEYALHVRAIHPVTGRAVEGVQVHGSLDVDADSGKPIVTKTVTTDREGFATLRVLLPAEIDDESVDFEVTGTVGNLSVKADGQIDMDNAIHSSMTTDKRLYQPGQTLHMRVMAFGPDKKAIADQAMTFKISDPDDTLVFTADAKTSKFGTASADWQIPGNLRLGEYVIEAADGSGDRIGGTSAEISRYDLPTFGVSATPDRTSYLPGQNAVIDVHADYLFGKPVRRGHVRVVHEADRKWNFHDQKWDIQQDGVWEGDTDGEGHYAAHVDLSKDQQALNDNDYERFSDLDFAAYFTDRSTGKTEQQRFTVRLTKDPIHIYVIEASQDEVKGLPAEMYVATDYADGTPASCDVEVRTDPGTDTPGGFAGAQRILRRVRTNRYGVAKISNLLLPDTGGTEEWEDLEFIARDGKGLTGRHVETIYESEEYGVNVATNKTLFKQGDPIDVSIRTNTPDETFIVDAVQDFRTIASQRIRIHGGYGALEFLPNEAFQNEVKIVAYALGVATNDSAFDSTISGERTVFFPKDDELKVDVKLAKASYKPGDDATAYLRVTGADGEEEKTVVGLAVVDEAVEQLEKTESEFGPAYSGGGYWSPRENPEEIAGIAERDLMKLDMSRPIPEGLDLVAEVLLRDGSTGLNTFDRDSQPHDLRKMFTAEIDPRITPQCPAAQAQSM